jgi:hypothetical protein
VTRACCANYINYRFIMEVSALEEAGWHWNAAVAAALTAAWLGTFALFTACVRFGVDPPFVSVMPLTILIDDVTMTESWECASSTDEFNALGIVRLLCTFGQGTCKTFQIGAEMTMTWL